MDTYGTQQPIALLKLLLEKGGMYDRGKDLNWKTFKDIMYLAAMGKVCAALHGYIGCHQCFVTHLNIIAVESQCIELHHCGLFCALSRMVLSLPYPVARWWPQSSGSQVHLSLQCLQHDLPFTRISASHIPCYTEGTSAAF